MSELDALIESTATAVMGYYHMRKRDFAGGCVVCGKTTSPQRDLSGEGLLRLSALLANGRPFRSDNSPLCFNHWSMYLKFRLRYADNEEKKLLVWLFDLCNYRDAINQYKLLTKKAQQIEETNWHKLARSTTDIELRKAIYRTYGPPTFKGNGRRCPWPSVLEIAYGLHSLGATYPQISEILANNGHVSRVTGKPYTISAISRWFIL
jgi:hypothetical protein